MLPAGTSESVNSHGSTRQRCLICALAGVISAVCIAVADRSASQTIPSSSAMLAAMQSKCDSSDTFPQRWSYPGTSVLSGNGGIMSSLKIGRVSNDSVLSSAVPATNESSNEPARNSSFKSDSQGDSSEFVVVLLLLATMACFLQLHLCCSFSDFCYRMHVF